jgi:hypothetical protein
MADIVTRGETSLGPEDVIVRAVQYFSTENWRPTSQGGRAATFQGKPPIPWFMLLLTFLAFFAFIIPGIIMYVMVFRKMYRFLNLVVTANAIGGGSEVLIQHPKRAIRLARRFLQALPPRPTADQAAATPWPSLLAGAPAQGALNPPSAVMPLPASAERGVAAQRAAQFCGECGAKVEPGSRFCESCGAQQ